MHLQYIEGNIIGTREKKYEKTHKPVDRQAQTTPVVLRDKQTKSQAPKHPILILNSERS